MNTIQTSPERKLKLCALPVCKGKRYDLVHKFPMNNERAQQWIDAINMPELKDLPLDNVRKKYFICSKHFRPQDYKNCESRSLNTTAYPRLHLGDHDNLPEDDLIHVENDSEQLHPTEYILELPETDTNKSSTIPISSTTLKNRKVPVIDSSSSERVWPNLLKKERKFQPSINTEKLEKDLKNPIPVKRFIKQIGISTDQSMQKRQNASGKEGGCSSINSSLEPIRKKLKTNERELANKTTQNEMSVDNDNTIVLEHKSLDCPLRVCSFWLRDHCRCAKCYGETSQRKFNIIDIPIDIKPIDLKTEDDNVCIKWSDGHESVYNILNLHNQLNVKPNSNKIKACHWSVADIIHADYANVTLNDYLCDDEVAKKVVISLIKFGCAFIKNVPTNLQSTEIAIRRLFPIQKTIFGEMWSFSDNMAHNDTAYTNEALPPHNDNTYFNDAAGLQILHCTNRSAVGGDNLLVDGFYVLNQLRRKNIDAFEQLCRICIPSEYIEDGYHFKHSAPVIILNPNTGEPEQIRFNMNDRAFFNNLPQEKMLEFYKHYVSLAKEINLDENNWRFTLEPGTVCIFDNWRLLHGRTEYSGRRNMVGCYVARSEYLSVARRYGLID